MQHFFRKRRVYYSQRELSTSGRRIQSLFFLTIAVPLEGPGFGGTPFQSQRGPNKSRLWTATIRRRRSRRCDLACRASLGAFWGLRYRRWGVGHLGLAACPVKLLQGGRPPTQQQAHASAAPDTKPDHDMHGGPAGGVHIFINTKVTVFTFVLLCTQLTCRCETSDDCVHVFLENMEAAVRA